MAAYPTVNLYPGSTNTTAVKQLQDYLVSIGLMTREQVNTGYGIYGPRTTAAVKSLQEQLGVDNSTGPGYWGPRTISAASGSQTSTPSQPSQPSAPSYSEAATIPYPEPTPEPVTVTPTETASGSPTTSLYGQPVRNAEWEGPALQQTKWAGEAAQTSGIIDSNFLGTIMSDPSVLGFYVNALAYGGYTIGDILNDMKRREMIATGSPDQAASAKSLKLIDPEMTRSAYQATAEGQKAYREAASIVSTFNLQGLLNPEILKYGANMPEELFKTLVPILDRTSQEFKDAVADVKSAFYDLANQQLQATTEQEKAIADYNYEQFKQQIEEQYGIVLSNNATKAWNQIEDLENTMSTRGISNSGIEAEGIDNVLQQTRRQDQRLRQEKLTREEQQMAATYMASATPAQIKALIDEDIAKGLSREEWRATKWGLVPSEDILAQYDMAALRQRYPDQSEAELKAYRDAVLDDNGNYRSTLYNKYYSGIASNLQAKKATAETQVLQDALNKETTAYRNYDQSQPFSVATGGDDAMVGEHAQATPNPVNQGEPLPAPEPTKSTTLTPGTASPTPITDMTQYYMKPGETAEQYNARIASLRSGGSTSSTYTAPTTNTYTAPKTTSYTAPTTNTYTAPKPTTSTSTLGTASPTPITDPSVYYYKPGETTEQYNARIAKARGY